MGSYDFMWVLTMKSRTSS